MMLNVYNSGVNCELKVFTSLFASHFQRENTPEAFASLVFKYMITDLS